MYIYTLRLHIYTHINYFDCNRYTRYYYYTQVRVNGKYVPRKMYSWYHYKLVKHDECCTVSQQNNL